MKVLVDYISELEGAVVHSGSVSCLSGTSCIITDAIENSVYNLSAVAVSEYGVSNWSDVLSLGIFFRSCLFSFKRMFCSVL